MRNRMSSDFIYEIKNSNNKVQATYITLRYFNN